MLPAGAAAGRHDVAEVAEMAAVLEVTEAERPALAFTLARLIPLLRRGTSEHRDVAERLAYTLEALDQAPAGPGEVELTAEDAYHIGVRGFLVTTDLEEFWLDRAALARGEEPAEAENPDVAEPAMRCFPELDANPLAWDFRTVQPLFLDLGFKIDRLVTAESPRVRGLYNRERQVIVATAVERRDANRNRRGQHTAVAADAAAMSAAANGAHAAQDEHAVEQPVTWPRPVGTAVAPVRSPAAGLSAVSAATFHGAYQWGVRTRTGVNAGELEPNKPRRLNIGGEALMLINVEGKVCALARICPHRGWDLSRGVVTDGVLTCGLHGAQFEACSGAVERHPYDSAFNREHGFLGGITGALDPKHTTDPLQHYPTSVADDGEVFIHI